jgi:hypothetical protein
MTSDASLTPEPFDTERFRAELAAEPVETEVSLELRRWRERAAVLAWFEPPMIGAPADAEALIESDDWLALVADCDTALTASDGPRRRLRAAKRREAIAGIGGREGLQQALRETVDRPIHDPLQQMLDALIGGEWIDLATLSQAHLYTLSVAAEWLGGLLDNLPDRQEIVQRLRREELLQPHRILAGSGFVGRESELAELRSYVEELPNEGLWSQIRGTALSLARRVLDRPPLVIFGPGGVGKSTLVARFILDHAERGGLVFVDLDFGRPNLDPRQPATLLAEAARQIATQIPSHLAEGDAVAADLEAATSSARRHREESARVVGLDTAVKQFASFAAAALPPDRKLPFVLDTFEEVEALGATRVEGIWSLLRSLQQYLPQLRPVICSRVPPLESVALLNLPLRELEPAAAAQYLQTRLLQRHQKTLTDKVVDDAVAAIARTPLGLNLAAELLAQATDAGEDPSRAVARIVGRSDEASLYQRILRQIKDPEVRQLATPGLAVRRLDVNVLRSVLAAPCGVKVPDEVTAQKLLDKLAKQVALVERQSDNSLLHRPDIRRLMLPGIEKSVGKQLVRQIDRAAADHYALLDDIIARTERVYHLLRLGALEEAEKLLDPDVAPRLRGSLEELEPDARLVLGLRLGVTPSSDELLAADETRWERGAIAATEDLLARGDYKRVLEFLATRPGRQQSGPLDRIEAEARLGLHDLAGALEVAHRGLGAAERQGNRETAIELALIVVRAGLATGNFDMAGDALTSAEVLTSPADSPDRRLRILSGRIRLAQTLGDYVAIEQAARQAADMLDDATLARLQPSVLRDLARELSGATVPVGAAAERVLRAALRRLGVEQKTVGMVEALAGTIADWIKVGEPDASDVRRALSSVANIPAPPSSLSDAKAWNDWLERVPGSQLGQAMAALLKLRRSPGTEEHAARLQSILTEQIAESSRAAQHS